VPDRADFETKVKVARVLADGGSMRQAAARAGVNVSTVSRWSSGEEPDFMAAQRAVSAWDETHPPVDFFPDLVAGSRGVPLGTEGPNMNDRIRAAAGRA
jgi:hypothetical protein